MYKAYKFRLYPNDKQKEIIHKTFGCTRFIYNYFLSECRKNGYIKVYDMCKELKKLIQVYPWLKEVDSCSLRNSIFNLEDSYKNYFQKRSNYPKFKNKYNKQSYRSPCIRGSYKGKDYCNIQTKLRDKKVKLPKLGLVDIRGYRTKKGIIGKIISATIEKAATGKYYVSIVEKNKKI